MKNSRNSSASGPSTTPAPAPSRKRFALVGPSQAFDSTTTAARADLADVRVADHIFAPHYAAPMPRQILRDVELERDRGGEPAEVLTTGQKFEVLELTTSHAWGVAASGTVGYVDRTALDGL